MGTQGYAAPENLMTGHLTARSDVYSFGVLLLELLTERKSVDKSRTSRELNLVEWARLMLNNPRKLGRIMDPRLEGQYSEVGAQRAATLAYHCLSFRPKQRPTMSLVVDIVKPLKDFDDVPVTYFVYTISTMKDNDYKQKENRTWKETDNHNHDPPPRQRNRHDHEHDHRRRQMNGPRSPLKESGVSGLCDNYSLVLL